MAHAVQQHQLGSRDGACGGAAAADVHERIVGPVQHERRDRDRPERSGAIAGGGDRRELAGHAGWIMGAIEGEAAPPPHIVLVELEPG